MKEIIERAGTPDIACSVLLGHTANSSDASIQSKLRIMRLSHQKPHSISSLVCYSPSIQKYAYRMTSEESRQSLEQALARPRKPDSTWQRLRARFYRCDVCREQSARLGNLLLRLAVRWPLLQTLLPSIRKTGQLDALIDRFEIESGGVLSTSAPALLVMRLKSYRDEWSRIVVWPNVES